MASLDSPDELHKETWREYYPKAINPEAAKKYGYFFVTKEIELWEGSTVVLGSNELTGVLGFKTKGINNDVVRLKIFSRLDLLEKQLRHGKQSDETMKDFELQVLQLKQIINDLIQPEARIDTLNIEPSKLLYTGFDWKEVANKIK